MKKKILNFILFLVFIKTSCSQSFTADTSQKLQKVNPNLILEHGECESTYKNKQLNLLNIF